MNIRFGSTAGPDWTNPQELQKKTRKGKERAGMVNSFCKLGWINTDDGCLSGCLYIGSIGGYGKKHGLCSGLVEDIDCPCRLVAVNLFCRDMPDNA